MAHDRALDDFETFHDDIDADLLASRRQGPVVEDDLDAMERSDAYGASPTTSTALSHVLLDPERLDGVDGDDGDVVAASEDEIVAAEAMDLAQFSRRGRGKDGFEDDVYEAWVKISRQYPTPLTEAEIDQLLRQVHDPDPEVVERAESTLIRHNVRWIVDCLKRNPYVGTAIIGTPGALREEALAWGRWGFILGVRNFDPERALTAGVPGRKKSLLGFTKFWIDKVVNEAMTVERFGLKQDASDDRKRVMKGRDGVMREKAAAAERVRRQLADYRAKERNAASEAERKALTAAIRDAMAELRRLASPPTAEEIAAYLEQRARERLTAQGVTTPSQKELRKRGALTVQRVRDLLAHVTQRSSLDQTTGGDGEDGPTLAEVIASGSCATDDGIVDQEVYHGLSARVQRVPRFKDRWVFRQQHGMPSELSGADYAVLNPAEAGQSIGVNRDTIDKRERLLRRFLWGEEEVRPDAVRPDPAVGDAETVGPPPEAMAADGVLVVNVDPVRKRRMRNLS